MQSEDAKKILAEVKKLPPSRRRLFSAYRCNSKSRKGYSDETAIILAGDKIGITPPSTSAHNRSITVDGLSQDSSTLSEGPPHADRSPQILSSQSAEDYRPGNDNSSKIEISPGEISVLASVDQSVSERQHATTPISLDGRSSTKFEHVLMWAQFLGCGVIFLILTAALVHFASKSGGGTNESWFMAAVTEGLGSLFLIARVSGVGSKVFVRSVGALCVAVGFFSIHLGVGHKTSSVIASKLNIEADIKSFDERIRLKLRDIENIQISLDKLSKVANRSKYQRQIQENSLELENLYQEKRALSASSGLQPSVDTAHSRGLIESLQRLITLLGSLICGHGAIRVFRRILLRPFGPDPPGPGV